MFNPQTFLQSAPTQPGVYRMLDDTGKILYVGKAKNLKKRLTSYFQRQPLEPKTARLVAKVANVELTVTATEVEALLLENTLIKKHKPRYNIIFKDDKSYPYLLLTNQPFPQLRVIRGLKKSLGTHFGPYPSVNAVRQTLETLFKTFRLRQCDDTFFHNRSRPCLQYQIKRCSAPCVGMIERGAYQRDVERVKSLLAGKSQQVLRELADEMEQAAESLQFEKAAALRDQIKALQPLQQQQVVDTQHAIDADVIVACERDQLSCVQVLFVRQGRILGNQTFFPVSAEVQTNSEVLTAFVEQFYANASGHYVLPQEVIVSDPILNTDSISEHWQTESGFSPTWKTQVRGIRQQWLQMAITNAEAALTSRLAHRQRYQGRFEDAARRLGLATVPKRIECFDISHFQGEATVASCVCFDHSGALKTHYRRFNIHDVTPGDDYAAIAQALSRHLERQLKANKPLAELILIDGGKGQLASAQSVVDQLRAQYALIPPEGSAFTSLQTLTLVGIAKGPERKSGLEDLWFSDRPLPLQLPEEASGFQLLREIRDEAHRFAITGHRKQRAHKRQQSILETIPGIGAKRRQAILQHFGGWQELQQATVAELQKVKGVSESLAREIVNTISHASDRRR